MVFFAFFPVFDRDDTCFFHNLTEVVNHTIAHKSCEPNVCLALLNRRFDNSFLKLTLFDLFMIETILSIAVLMKDSYECLLDLFVKLSDVVFLQIENTFRQPVKQIGDFYNIRAFLELEKANFSVSWSID